MGMLHNSDKFPQCLNQIRHEKKNQIELNICIMKENQITLSAFKDLDRAESRYFY